MALVHHIVGSEEQVSRLFDLHVVLRDAHLVRVLSQESLSIFSQLLHRLRLTFTEALHSELQTNSHQLAILDLYG